MRQLFFMLSLAMGISSAAQEPSLTSVRALYQEAEAGEEAAETLLEHLEEVGKEQPVLLAYKAGVTMMMAQYAFLPFKLKYFKEGKELMRQAIDAAPNHLEIRLLRFSLQSETPGFLGYKEHIKADKEFLLEKLPVVKDPELKALMLPILLKSDYLTEEEKECLTGIMKSQT